MNILIRGGNFTGKGAEAMLFTVRQELSKRIPHTRFCVELSADEEEAALAADFIPVIKKGWPSDNPLKKLVHLSVSVLTHPCTLSYALTKPGEFLMIRERMQGVDAVVDINGYAYGDPWAQEDFALTTCAFVKYCRRTSKPYLFLPQAWGPFTHPDITSLTREMCLSSRAFYARDEQSQAYLADLLGKNKNEIDRGNDIAFRFRSAEAKEGTALLSRLGITAGEQPVIGIAPNMRVYDRMPGKGAENQYVQTLIEVVKFCRRLQASAVVLPHEINADSEIRDDRYLCELIVSALRDKENIGAITTRESSSNLKSLIGQLDLLIGSRFHSIVAALSSRVPCVVLGWSHKYDELMGMVGLERYVIRHEELEQEKILEIIAEAWNHRKDLSKQLSHRLPAIEKSVDELFDQIARKIQGAS